MRKVLAIIIMLLLIQPGIAQAQDRSSGNYFRLLCSQAQLGSVNLNYESGYCMGFVDGASQILNAWRGIGEGAVICLPSTVTVGQMVSIFVKYLNNHPERLHESAAFLFFAAMREAFPCT